MIEIWKDITAKENSIHSYKSGLCKKPPTKYGENSNSAKLTVKKVKEIRELHSKYKYSELARMYNVSGSTISSIIKNKIWVNV